MDLHMKYNRHMRWLFSFTEYTISISDFSRPKDLQLKKSANSVQWTRKAQTAPETTVESDDSDTADDLAENS